MPVTAGGWPDATIWWGAIVNATTAINYYLQNHPNYFTYVKWVTDIDATGVNYASQSSVSAAQAAYLQAYNSLTALGIAMGSYISGTNVMPLANEDRYTYSIVPKEFMPSNSVYLGTFITSFRFAIDPGDPTTVSAFHTQIRAQWDQTTYIKYRFVDNSCSLQGGPYGSWADQMANVRAINLIAQSMGAKAVFNASIVVGTLSSGDMSLFLNAIEGAGVCLENPWGPSIQASASLTAAAVTQYRQILDQASAVVMIGYGSGTLASPAQLRAWTATWRVDTDPLYLAESFFSLPDPAIYLLSNVPPPPPPPPTGPPQDALVETHHPYPTGWNADFSSFTLPPPLTYTVPSWPGGTHTVYITFSRDFALNSYFGNVSEDHTSFNASDDDNLVVSTDLDSYAPIYGTQGAGLTVALNSSDGVITFTLSHNGGEYYGYRVVEVTTGTPSRFIGNSNADDATYPVALLRASDNDFLNPGWVPRGLDNAYAQEILPTQINLPYTYQFTFRGCPSGSPTYALTAGALPPGVTMDSSGLVSGTPTVLGPYVFSITATCGMISAAGTFQLNVYRKPTVVQDGRTSYDYPDPASRYAFHRLGNRYAVLTHTGGTSRPPHVFKSTDDALTWVELDAAHAPTGNEGGFTCLADDGATTLTFALNDNFITTTLISFNLSTELWGSVFSTQSFSIGYSRVRPHTAMWLTDGRLRIVYLADGSGAAGSNVFLVDYTPSTNAWGTLLQLGVAGQFYNPVTAVNQPLSFVDGSTINVTHVWFAVDDLVTLGSGRRQFIYKRIDDSYTITNTFTEPHGQADFATDPVGGAVFDVATNSIVIPGSINGVPDLGAAGSGAMPAVWRGTPCENPTWTYEYIAEWNTSVSALDTVMQSGLSYYLTYQAVVLPDGKIAVFWSAQSFITGESGHGSSLWMSVNDGSGPHGWSRPYEYWSAIWNPFTTDPANQSLDDTLEPWTCVEVIPSATAGSYTNPASVIDVVINTDDGRNFDGPSAFCLPRPYDHSPSLTGGGGGFPPPVITPFRIIVDLYGDTQLSAILPPDAPVGTQAPAVFT